MVEEFPITACIPVLLRERKLLGIQVGQED